MRKIMPKVKLTVTVSKCRCGIVKQGQEFIVEDLCPPICHELWNSIYPCVYALLNGATLDYGNERAKCFDMKCPDEGRVILHGEAIESNDPELIGKEEKTTKQDAKDMIKTERLVIRMATDEEMQKLIENETNEEMKKAYGEMLSFSLANPTCRKWYIAWLIELADGTRIGDLCFKGLSSDGMVEIGYGLFPDFQGKGYMTEAVKGMVAWVIAQEGVKRVEAETEENNVASQRVLKKSGFVPTGKIGEEGPRFVWNGQA